MPDRPAFKIPGHPSFLSLVVPGNHPESVDGSDFTLGIVRQALHDYFRVAQVGLRIDGNTLEVANIQGSGPYQKFAAYGLDTKAFFDSFRRLTGLKPLNTLLAVAILCAKERGKFRRIVCDPKKDGEFNYRTVLQALQFRPARNRPDLLQLDLGIDEAAVLERVTGKSPEKRATFDSIRNAFRERLGSCWETPHKMTAVSSLRPSLSLEIPGATV